MSVAPELIKWGRGTRPARSAGNFFVVLLHFIGSKSTIIRVGERFRDGQYSLVSFLFAVLLLTVPPWPMESAPRLVHNLFVY